MAATGRFLPVATLLSDRQLLGESCRSKNRSNVPLMGGVDLDDYPSVARWIEQIKLLPRFVSMEGLTPAG